MCSRRLGQSLEPLEGVVDEDPVLVRLAALTGRGRCNTNVTTNSPTCRLSPISRATSGKSSKLEVSSMEVTVTGLAAGRSLMWLQSTPWSQSRLLRSSTLCTRSSLSLQNLQPGHHIRLCNIHCYLWMVSIAFSDIGGKGGNSKVVCQFMTFLYVSWGVSEQKGG